jgi:hypothetical protein
MMASLSFEDFIEKDMLQYLDRRTSEIHNKASMQREEEFSMFEITSDYAKEINNALRQQDIEKAKQLLDEVKSKYFQASEGSISKKRLYAILEEIYERIKDYEESDGKQGILDTIKEYEKEAILRSPELFSKKIEGIGIITSAINLKEKEIEDILANGSASYIEIEKAAKAYRELKELIRNIPDEHEDLKGKASEKALSLYNALKERLANKGKGKPKEKTVEEESRILEDKLAELRLLKSKVVESHNAILVYLDDEDLVSAAKEYRKLKKYCYLFPKDLGAERLALLAEAKALYDKIHALRLRLEAEPVNQATASSERQRLSGKQLSSSTAGKEGTAEVAVSEEELQRQRDSIRVSQRIIEEQLRQGKVNEAAVEYERLKTCCKAFPKEHNPHEKVEILSSALAIFGRIKKAKEALVKAGKSQVEENILEEENKARFNAFRAELLSRVGHVKEFLLQKDSQNAIKEYGMLKELFNSYPDDELDNKKMLYDDILGAHLDMALLDKDFKNNSPAKSGVENKAIIGVINDAVQLVEQGRLDEASHLVLEAKHKVMLLPRDDFDDKYAFIKEIEELEGRILMSKNLQRAEHSRDSAAALQAQKGDI